MHKIMMLYSGAFVECNQQIISANHERLKEKHQAQRKGDIMKKLKLKNIICAALAICSVASIALTGCTEPQLAEPVFPTYGNGQIELGIFSSPAPTQDAYNECAEAGFTFVATDQNYYSIDSSNFKTLIEYANNAGMVTLPMTFNTNNKTDFTDVPGYAGKYFWDEPNYTKFDTIASWVDEFEELNGTDKWFFVNLYPYFAGDALGCDTYEEYLQGYVDKVLSKVDGTKWFSIDIYPLCSNVRGNYILDGYLYNLEASAQIALANPDLLTHYYVLTHGHGAAGNGYRDLESVADIRFQYNCAMAFGVKAFSVFTYKSQSGADFSWGHGLVKNTKIGNTWVTERTPTYDYVKQANMELKEWDQVYLSFDYKGTKAIVGTLNERGYNDNFDLMQYNKEQLSGVTKVTATQDTLIGEFSKDGTRAFMITNFVEPSTGHTDKVVMELATGRRAQIYINGQMTEQNIINNQLAVTLKAGEAAFVVIAE